MMNFEKMGYDECQKVLGPAFDKIKDKEHWKNPINAVIDRKDFKNCMNACVYFTGSNLTMVLDNSLPDDKCRVRADGYYLAIGA
jgi:hypothetical protein